MRYRPRHIAEYAALRLISGLFQLLPYRAGLVITWFLAGLTFHVARYRRAEISRRIRAVFPDMPARRVNRIAWISLRNTAFGALEMIRNSMIDADWIGRHFTDAKYARTLAEHCRSGRGAILAVPHMGSWEAAAIACHLQGIPIFTLAAAQKNPLSDAYMNHLRRRPGIDTVIRGSGVIIEIIKRLKGGSVLAILPDVRMRKPALAIPFLGGMANIGEGTAVFARHVGIPIFPGVIKRRGWTTFEPVLFPPILPDRSQDRDAELRRMTTEIMRIFEAEILKEPEQWFWYNSRWILDPIDAAKARESDDAADD